jgi:hypothetical protein
MTSNKVSGEGANDLVLQELERINSQHALWAPRVQWRLTVFLLFALAVVFSGILTSGTRYLWIPAALFVCMICSAVWYSRARTAAGIHPER